MKYNYIAIEREYASGGQEIGTLAAEKLGIPCYGREILEKTAQRENISVDYIEEMEENPQGSFLYSLYKISGMSNGSFGKATAAEKDCGRRSGCVCRKMCGICNQGKKRCSESFCSCGY